MPIFKVKISCLSKTFEQKFNSGSSSQAAEDYLTLLKSTSRAEVTGSNGKYRVEVKVSGHTFNVKGVHAKNSEDAGNRALRLIRSSMKVESVVNDGPAIDFFKDIFGFK